MNKQEIDSALRVRNLLRQQCRTDMLALCKVLGYKDVCREVHGPILDELQKFKGGEDIEVSPGKWQYKPFVPHWQLEGSRQNLFLYPRGHLKTSIISIAHTIQWIINYPNIRVLISCATGDQVEIVMGGLLNQFRFNQNLRALFPEICPPYAKAADWGSKDKFTIPARNDFTLKEPTVWCCTVGKTVAGGRADVEKHSDLVDQQNVKTPGGIKEVISHFGHLEPLRERYNAAEGLAASQGWVDVEGTRYDFGDLYGILLEASGWNHIVRSAIDEDGKALWPQRFPLEELERIRKQPHVGDWIFSAQYLNKCVPQGDGLCDPKDVIFIPANIVGNLLPQLRLHCTIDLSGMEQIRSNDYTVLTVGGFDRNGRLYIIEIYCGHYSPEQVIALIFTIHAKYPQIIDFKIEKEAHSRVLLPFLQREMAIRKRYPMIYPIKRDTHTSKQHRIRGLRPWFKNPLGIIRFSDAIELSAKTELLKEVAQFPSESSGVHDDILDTLADMMQNTDGGVTSDVIADDPDMSRSQFGQDKPRDRFLGFREDGVAQWLYGPDQPESDLRAPTGIL